MELEALTEPLPPRGRDNDPEHALVAATTATATATATAHRGLLPHGSDNSSTAPADALVDIADDLVHHDDVDHAAAFENNSAPTTGALSSSSPAVVLHAKQPSDATLLKNVLGPWVATREHKTGQAQVVDIYSAEPDVLTRRFPATVSEDGNMIWYFLSELRSKSKGPDGHHKSRTVAPEAARCWRSEAAAKKIFDPFDGGRLIGYIHKLYFVQKGADGARVRTGWEMAEYQLHKYGDDEGDAGTKIEGLVLGKVYKKNVARGGAAKKNGGDEVSATPAAAAPYVDDHGTGATTAAAAPPVPKPASKRAVAVTPNHIARGDAAKKNGGDEVGATPAAAAPYHDDCETGATTAAAAPPVPKPASKRAAAADDKAAPVPKPVRKRTADDKAAPVPEPAHKRAAAGAYAARSAAASSASWIHCPRCGLHLGAIKAIVTPIQSQSVGHPNSSI